jgi:hypothetical protein
MQWKRTRDGYSIFPRATASIDKKTNTLVLDFCKSDDIKPTQSYLSSFGTIDQVYTEFPRHCSSIQEMAPWLQGAWSMIHLWMRTNNQDHATISDEEQLLLSAQILDAMACLDVDWSRTHRRDNTRHLATLQYWMLNKPPSTSIENEDLWGLIGDYLPGTTLFIASTTARPSIYGLRWPVIGLAPHYARQGDEILAADWYHGEFHRGICRQQYPLDWSFVLRKTSIPSAKPRPLDEGVQASNDFPNTGQVGAPIGQPDDHEAEIFIGECMWSFLYKEDESVDSEDESPFLMPRKSRQQLRLR